jgi:hypothetical protein
MDVVRIDECRYEIWVQKEIPVYYTVNTGPFWALSKNTLK